MSINKFFLSLNGSELFFLLQNGLEWNPEHFYLPWNGSKQNDEVLSIFSLIGNSLKQNSQLFYLPQTGSDRNSSIFYSTKQMEFQHFRLLRVPQNNFF